MKLKTLKQICIATAMMATFVVHAGVSGDNPKGIDLLTDLHRAKA
jgi:hypothetical protein